jgi:glycosyltransferase involved in cell wall biosynthesis
MRLICWYPLMTDHQAYTLIALAARVEQMQVYTWRSDDIIRSAQGWRRFSGPAGEERTVPLDRWWSWARGILKEDRDAIHLFGSPFEDLRQIAVMLMACAMGRRVAIISEPYSVNDVGYFTATPHWKDRLKRRLRPLLYRGYGALFGRRLDVVFAISPLACEQYEAMGVRRERIAPFGYFVPAEADGATRRSRTPGPLRLAFIGSMIPRKGIDTALAAVATVRASGRAITLDLYGPGTPRTLPADGSVAYHGTLPFGGVAAPLREYDALVVPSLFDGWGVVVNEAIQAGLPVIASDATGAGAFVTAHQCGLVFPAGNASALAALLDRWFDNPALVAAARDAAAAAAALLDPVVAADYMDRALEARGRGEAVPTAPWYPHLTKTSA